MAGDGLGAVGVDREVQARGEAHGAEHAHGVFAEADVGVSDRTQRLLGEVAQATGVVDDLRGGDVVEEGVDREVAAQRVLLGGAERVVRALVEGAWRAGVGRLDLVGLRRAPEGGGLDLLVAEADQREAEAAADDERVAEEPADLVRVRVRGDVEVLRGASEEEVSHAAADEVGGEAGLVEPVQDGDGVWIDGFDGDGLVDFFAGEKRHHAWSVRIGIGFRRLGARRRRGSGGAASGSAPAS